MTVSFEEATVCHGSAVLICPAALAAAAVDCALPPARRGDTAALHLPVLNVSMQLLSTASFESVFRIYNDGASSHGR